MLQGRFFVLALALLVGCGSDGGSVPDGGTAEDGGAAPDADGNDDAGIDTECDTLEACLNVLGVDTTATARLNPDGEELPESYAPLGASASLGHTEELSDDSAANPTDELFIVNLRIPGVADKLPLVEKRNVQVDASGEIDSGGTAALHSLRDAENPWVTDDSSHPRDGDVGMTRRDVTAGDIDGDGLEELVVVFVDDSSASPVLTAKIIDDQEGEFGEMQGAFAPADGVFDVTVTTGDFDGDGTAEIAVGASGADGAEVFFLTGASEGDLAVDEAAGKSYELSAEDNVLTLELATGNLDYDNGEELVVVANEMSWSGGMTGVATYFAYDDAGADYALLGSDAVAGRAAAQVADVDLGDVDGDGLDEIVLGGLTGFNYTIDDVHPYLVVVLDDAERELAPLVTEVVDDNSFDRNPAHAPWKFRFVHVNAFDLDGDGVDEIHANERIFEDLSESPELDEIHRLPTSAFVEDEDDPSAVLNATTFSIVTGDVTGDGREDLTTYSQYQEDIRMYGKTSIDTVGDEGFVEWSRILYGTTYNASNTPRPILTTANVDTDSAALKYSEGSYELVFTEPVLVAAMAAAPCSEGIGQNLGACATTFGQAESMTVSREVTVSTKVSAYVGFSLGLTIPWVGPVKTDFKHKVTLKASLSAGESYTVERSEVFTTGSLEDSVIFTTTPYDVYTYEVLAHPIEDNVGGTVTVALPREPLMIKAEREFYNATIDDEGIPVGRSVFEHTVGDLTSYPSASRKDELLRTHEGLENGPQSVGQGTGSTGLALNVSSAVSKGGSLGIEYETSVDVTAGPALAGYSVGTGIGASLQITSGESTTYSVTVGDLDAESFHAQQYSYGIFSYVQDIEDQQLQVINFWVE